MSESESQAEHKPTTEGRRVARYVLLSAFFPMLLPAVVSAAVFAFSDIEKLRSVKSKTDYATISYPNRTHRVGNTFTSYGEVHEIEPGTYVYLTSTVDQSHWPKLDITKSKAWKLDMTTSDGSGYQYSIAVIAVDSKGKNTIDQWFARGSETGQYPPLQKLSGLKILAQAKVIK